ncbi:hypothetical protein DXX93_06330 [Thalassotalea euphylliae]|uniref:Porin n=1 Tax=Thalassotalea euphylliae TaxID=1655234 RepID=A0A3E0TPF9_9GAMM|nr:hypothetical protein [Thalassotalea euphylliae]REL26237.1 hypothetical protein DXX93_06330 [Thalassotalea euphylliae]
MLYKAKRSLLISTISVLTSTTGALYSTNLHAQNAEPQVNIGGGARFNYSWRDYDNDSNGKFEFELFRIDADVTQGKWFLDAQYRWYQDFDTVHHAEIGYKLDEQNTIVGGVTQVPFGMEPYGSDSFWFTGAYYLGLEDDYDFGVKWRHEGGNWNADVAYFFNGEYDDGARYGRYSFDIANTPDQANREDGQVNGRIQYTIDNHSFGASLQAGKFINSDSLDKGDHWAAGAHYKGIYGSWTVRAQLMQYDYETKASLGTDDHRIALSAFEFPFDIATKATLSNLNIAKTFTFNNDFVDTVTCYNEATVINPTDEAGLTESIQNVTGCNLAKGGLYTYIDWIAGKNMWFVGGPGVGIEQGPNRWRSRLNINIGYYF